MIVSLLLLGTAVSSIASPTFRTDEQLVAEYGPPVPLPRPLYHSAPLRAGAPTTLRAAAAARGVYIGAAINEACYTNTSEPYATTYLAELDLVGSISARYRRRQTHTLTHPAHHSYTGDVRKRVQVCTNRALRRQL